MKTKLAHKTANLFLFVLSLLLFAFADTAADAARSSLTVCASAVIPSLFPFMVLSDLIVRRRLLDPLCRHLPMGALFGLPSSAGNAFLLGALCGFPIGAKTVCSLYQSGRLTKKEAERTCALSNNTGPAFAVCVAGGHFFGDKRIGLVLYFGQLLSVLLIGMLIKRNRSGGRIGEDPLTDNESPFRSFAMAVTGAAKAILPLVGYIVFFSVISAIVGELIPSDLLKTVISCMLEISAGLRCSASFGGIAGRFLGGFALGFGGISVLIQSYSFTSDAGLSLRQTAAVKAVQGFLTGMFCVMGSLFAL